MNRRRLLTGFLTFCLLFQSAGVTSLAADGEDEKGPSEPYTYSITFYAGNQGAFAGTDGITVLENGSAAGAGIEKVMREDGSAITVKGLKAGDQVTFNDIQSQGDGAPVKFKEEDSQYYVRGLRKGGYDNDTVSSPSFTVEQDQDYVVAYGIKGEMVSYVIHYQDTDGKTLAPSRTYYGNVGDRPVVAFLYIEGYEPQAYNLTEELSKNEAENVFTFVYTREVQTPAVQPEPAPEPAPWNPAEVPPAGGVTVIPATPAPPGEEPGEGGELPQDGETPDEGEEPQTPDEGTEIPDNETPVGNAPDELRDMDESQTPLGGLCEIGSDARLLGIPVPVVIITALGAIGAAWFFLIAKRRKKEEKS